MRVLQVLDKGPADGGVAVHVEALSAGLRRAGHQVQTLRLLQPAQPAPLREGDRHRLAAGDGVLDGLRQRAALATILHDVEPQVIHVHGGFGRISPPLLAQLRPDVVLLPCFTDRHADHFAASRCLVAAGDRLGAGACTSLGVLGFEAGAPMYANLVVDVAPVYDRKLRAIACHASQTASADNLGGVDGLNRFRGVAAMARTTHAEAFLAAPLATYGRLYERLLP